MHDVGKQIARTLKALRKEHGWSLDKTAQETGVSKAMLGQIEREESSPTMATLWKIAGGFHTSYSSFLETIDTNLANSIHRSGQVKSLSPMDDKIQIITLFPFDAQLNFEIFIIELLPTCEHVSLPHEDGVIEHAIVTEGTIEILCNDVWQKLNKGEGLRFNANQTHGYRNKTRKKACFHNIIHYSKKTT